MARKKDRQVMSILLSMISNEVTHELDVEKTSKQMWNTLKVKSGGVTWFRKAWIQSLKTNYDNLSMDDNDLFPTSLENSLVW